MSNVSYKISQLYLFDEIVNCVSLIEEMMSNGYKVITILRWAVQIEKGLYIFRIILLHLVLF